MKRRRASGALGGGLRIVVVVGAGSGCGKTTAACRILQAIPGLGAVKISPRGGAGSVEWGPGERGKDTSRFAGSGAVLVARIVAPREIVKPTWDQIKAGFSGCRGVVVEGASALEFTEERFVVFVAGEPGAGTRGERSDALAARSDAVVDGASDLGADSLTAAVRAFFAGPARGES